MRTLTIAAVVLASATAFCQGQGRFEQATFAAEEAIQAPVELPGAVLGVLQQDERNRTCLSEGQSPEQMPADWFSAAEISLTGKPRTGLVVKPQNTCLFGANIVPFWVFERTLHEYRLVLYTHVLNLRILNTRTNGHRDIETGKASAVTAHTAVYEFRHGRYELAKSSSKPIR